METSQKPIAPNPKVVYSCYFDVARAGEHFIGEHILSYQISGTMIMNDGDKTYVFNAGDIRFHKRNRLLKFQKMPSNGEPFRSVSIYLDQEMLKKVSIFKNITPPACEKGDAVIELTSHPLLESYFKSLMPYENKTDQLNAHLVHLKVKEAIMILLELEPTLKDSLFDFSEPGKIDLENFMNQNFHFNVQMSRFAYLTGRSLATFKRDFQKTFQSTPSRWLLQKRLSEAYYQIKENGKAPNDVYLELGFENLSHFSFAFKKAYGVPPSRLKQDYIRVDSHKAFMTSEV